MVKGASGQLLRQHTQNCFLVCSFRAWASTHVLMQPRRLSRAAGRLCRKQAWNARSKQRHVPDTKQVLLWKGWVRNQRLNDVQSRVGAAATRAQVESPLRTELFVDSCSVRHQGNCCASTREIRATWISICTQGTEGCSCDKTAALARHKHTWISLRAQTDMFMRQHCCILTPRAHLDLFPCANRHVHATCSCDSTAAFARCEHMDLPPKETCSGAKTAAFSRREHT